MLTADIVSFRLHGQEFILGHKGYTPELRCMTLVRMIQNRVFFSTDVRINQQKDGGLYLKACTAARLSDFRD